MYALLKLVSVQMPPSMFECFLCVGVCFVWVWVLWMWRLVLRVFFSTNSSLCYLCVKLSMYVMIFVHESLMWFVLTWEFVSLVAVCVDVNVHMCMCVRICASLWKFVYGSDRMLLYVFVYVQMRISFILFLFVCVCVCDLRNVMIHEQHQDSKSGCLL